MAQLKYNSNGRLLFTKEMKKDYTLLMPMMLPIHFGFLKNIFELHGFHAQLLDTTGHDVIEEGLKDVHNDICYPAILTTGQLMNALKSGKYDMNKTALIMSQTGGGCRASNYIHLIRKTLKNHHLNHIPVLSFNVVGLEKNPGFKMTPKMISQFFYAVMYGDILMWLSNQTRPYEAHEGDTQKMLDKWINDINEQMKSSKSFLPRKAKVNFDHIVQDFAAIELIPTSKVKVGIVGEIYIKYAALGNNNLEEFLHNEDVEVVVPALLDFLLYSLSNVITDYELYKTGYFKAKAVKLGFKVIYSLQNKVTTSIKTYSSFRPMQSFEHIKELAREYVSLGSKMGEGWLLTAEMLELIDSGVENIICTQPFGCLPNHIVGKGMIRAIKKNHPYSNIVAIDYDAGATKINQENRIKLMLSTARKNLDDIASNKDNKKQSSKQAV
jgi:predicted nucleotide-binding protein (sugar kinase/HSP70/actin superfamily)